MPRQVKLSENLNSSILSVGTETLGLSSSSSNSDNMKNISKSQTGGFFGLFSDKMAKLALEACKKSEFQVVLFLILEDKICDFSEACPETGFTILHYLVAYYNMIYSVDTRIEGAMKKLLSRSDVKKFINKQDNTYGNTALHLATMSKNFELANMLVNAGADLRIRNKNDMYVGTDSESDVMREVDRQSQMANLTRIRDSASDSDVFIKSPSISKMNQKEMSNNSTDNVKNMVKTLFNMEHRGGYSPSSATDLPSTLGLTETQNNKKVSSDYLANPQDTEQFLNAMIKNYSGAQSGGQSNANQNNNKLNSEYEPAIQNTEQFLNSMIKTYSGAQSSNQQGGRVSGSRQMTTASMLESDLSDDFTMSGGRSAKPLSEMSELSRMIENQADKTHQRVVQKIMEILNVDNLTARAYKALLYAKVKSEKPELNNYDRAVEMEKIATNDIIENLDKSKMEEIKQHLQQKDKERAERPPQPRSVVSSSEEAPVKKSKTSKKAKEVVTDSSDLSLSSSEEVPKAKSKKKAPSKKTKRASSKKVSSKKNSKKFKEASFSDTSSFALSSDAYLSSTSDI